MKENSETFVKDTKELAEELYDEFFEGKAFATQMYEMFSHRVEYMWDYVRVGRQFWCYNDEKCRYELITVTYKRSGVAFYTAENDETEHYFLRGSIQFGLMYPRVIYANELKKFSSECYGGDEEGVMKLLTKLKPCIPADYVKIDIEF